MVNPLTNIDTEIRLGELISIIVASIAILLSIRPEIMKIPWKKVGFFIFFIGLLIVSWFESQLAFEPVANITSEIIFNYPSVVETFKITPHSVAYTIVVSLGVLLIGPFTTYITYTEIRCFIKNNEADPLNLKK